jgi:hypothetical protein
MSQQSTESRLGGEGPVRVTARRSATEGRGRNDLLRETELIVLIALILAVLIAAAFAGNFGAARAWTLVTVLGAAYILSRGLARFGRHD